MSIPPARGGIWATCEVRTGSLRDTILHSVGANATHGLRRTNADKRRAVRLLLEDAEWSGWSDNAIAKACHVHHSFVGKLRNTCAVASEPRTYQDRYGNVTQMRTSSIGRKPVEDAASSPTPNSPLDPRLFQ